MIKTTNEKTLQAYEAQVDRYLANTPNQVSGEVKDWIDLTLTYVDKSSKILELGSGFGRDAEYMQSLGYSIKTTDAAISFIEILKSKGFQANLLNVLTDELMGNYNLVFANAVLLHFTPTELRIILNKIYNVLDQESILAFTVKQGKGEEWEKEKLGEPRYFCYWTPELLDKLLVKCGFTILKSNLTADAKWLQYICKKDGFIVK